MVKILVVDDDEILRNVIRHILEHNGYDVIEADDGDVAIELARTEQPDLILLDMVLPKMTGVEVAPIIKTHPKTKNIPIIALTASQASEGAEDAHMAGCDRYMTKPIDQQRLLHTVALFVTEK